MKTLKERIEVMQACLDGETIEVVDNNKTGRWVVADYIPNFNWSSCNYRIKPEPMVIWVNIYPIEFCGHKTKELSKGFAGLTDRTAVKFIEVIE